MSKSTGRRLAAIVSADVVGYARLVGADEDGTIATLRTYRAGIIEPLLRRHGGRIANTAGDSLLIEFASAVDAVRCAAAMQREIAARNADVPTDRRLEFRIGINVGDVVVQGDDLLGDGVNVAARLEATAEPGSLCVSAAVHDQIAGKLALDFVDLGELRLKNIERPVRAYALLDDAEAHPNGRAAAVSSKEAGAAFDFDKFKRLSIVVMPFRDLGGAEEGALAEGLRLSLHSVLIKLPGFFLLHTGAVEDYRGQAYSAVDVGHQIDVRYVVGAAVQRAGDRVRVIVELTDTRAREVVWGETYDRVLDDVFRLQDEIAREIVNALDVTLRAGDVGRILFEATSDPSVREYLHRGVSHLYRGDRDNTSKARQLLETVERVEPDLATCVGMIAMTHWRDARFGWSADPQASLEKAADYARRAVELGDSEGLGHVVLGYVELHRRRHEAAMALCVEALSRRPSCPLSNGLLAEVLRYCGNPGGSIARMKEAMKLARTFPPWMIDNLAASLRDNDQVKASISVANEAARLFPDNIDVLVTLCCDYGYCAMPKAARAAAGQILAADPAFSIDRYAQSQPYKDRAVLGHIVESLRQAGLAD
ncbi:adenylate/guanylate cyclase domain-containing protein [Microbaculum sp. FT89]|uniref:adenylate/guanylate cyclase domain-containing protein n=1 Tax=Microbaculum sp. FT89 TaxID=3447298 RepID=UPI003F532CE7